jgi:hypothetical protein
MDSGLPNFPCFVSDYSNMRKIRPSIGGDMVDNVPLIALFGFSSIDNLLTKLLISRHAMGDPVL